MSGPTAFPPSGTPDPDAPRGWTIYVDMDAYYVSCELRDRPELRGKPVIVGPDPGIRPTRGVVLSASYEARAFGVRSALPAARAARLCPDAVWIPADFSKYGRIAEEIRERLAGPGRRVIPLSVDEAAIEVGPQSADSAGRLAREIQEDLLRDLHLPASLGVSMDRTIAKVASDRAKPGGVIVVPPEGAAEFLSLLPVESVPGVGPKTAERLHAAGVTTIGSLTTVPMARLRRAVGSFAPELVALARGTPRPRAPESEDRGPRSRSTARTFAADLSDLAEVHVALARLSDDLAQELDRERLRYQTVTVAARWEDFGRTQRNHTLPAAHEDTATLATSGRRLLDELWTEESRGRRRRIRTLSIGVERLSPRRQHQQLLEDFGRAPLTKAISGGPMRTDDAE